MWKIEKPQKHVPRPDVHCLHFIACEKNRNIRSSLRQHRQSCIVEERRHIDGFSPSNVRCYKFPHLHFQGKTEPNKKKKTEKRKKNSMNYVQRRLSALKSDVLWVFDVPITILLLIFLRCSFLGAKLISAITFKFVRQIKKHTHTLEIRSFNFFFHYFARFC